MALLHLRGRRLASCLLVGLLALGALAVPDSGTAQQAAGPVRVTVRDEQNTSAAAEPVLPVDPQPRIQIGNGIGNGDEMAFGLSVNGQRLCYNPQGGIATTFRINGQMIYPANGVGTWEVRRQALPPSRLGKQRYGFTCVWVHNRIRVTQVVEIVPSRPAKKAGGQKRLLDTVLVRYTVENKNAVAQEIGVRVYMDTYVIDNDGCLFAAPSTHPGKILDGVELKDKQLPDVLQALQRPDLKNPGFVANYTLKFGKRLEGPNRVVVTQLGRLAPDGWNVIPAPAMGDSAMGMFWDPQKLPPNGKRELVYAYGVGVASNPESEGRVNLALGGSFEPNKQFTITAYVEDPLPGQTLTLELPKGMERVEGKELQPVPPPGDEGAGLVLWKARVLETGTFPLRVRSSNGLTLTRHITISRN
jgi:hypothetical protein